MKNTTMLINTNKQFKNDQKQLKEIFAELESGKIKIPLFQRNYVWKENHIKELLNSIVSSEPIGNIILWETNDKFDIKNSILENISKNKDHSDYLFVIDGQQRLTTLISCFYFNELDKLELKEHIKKFSKIVFNFETNEFETISKEKIVDRNKYKINEIFCKAEDIDNIINEKEAGYGEELHKFRSIERVQNKFLDLSIGVLCLKNGFELDDAINVFEKINTKGKKLSVFDIVNAKWNTFGIYLENIFKDLPEYKKGFDIQIIDNETLLDSIFLVVSDTPILKSKDKIHFEVSDEKIINETIEKWKKSLWLAEDFLFNKIGFSTKTIPSKNIVKWCIYLFFKNENKPLVNNEISQIKKYIGLLCINHSYEKNTNAVLEKNILFINSLLSGKQNIIDEHLNNFKTKEIKENYFFEELDESSKNDMVAKLITSFLWKKNDFLEGTTINNEYDLHHIFPREGYKKEDGYNQAEISKIISSYSNLTPINKNTNQKIKNKKFSSYFNEYKENKNSSIEEHLSDHGINAALWKQDDSIDNMLKAVKDRSKELAKKINEEFNLKQ
ncbi:MAG: GmrSD restriction endonuclease domain-containing protein [Metamycoplasmataceae bacterium]